MCKDEDRGQVVNRLMNKLRMDLTLRKVGILKDFKQKNNDQNYAFRKLFWLQCSNLSVYS